MAINKVVYGNDTLIDLTNDTVEASNLLEGETAHDRSGSPVTGTAKQGHVVQNSSGTDMTQRSKLQFADAEVSDDSTNGKTVVTVVREMTRAQFNALPQAERYGIIRITDDGNRLIDASEVSYNNETVKSKLDSLTTEVNGKTDENPTFTEASTRENIVSGETFAVILGKIKKWFSDLASMFVSKSGDTITGHLYVRGSVIDDRQNGTASTAGGSYLVAGNATAQGTAGNSRGYLWLYGLGTTYTQLASQITTNNITVLLPNKTGTLALTSDLLKRTIKSANLSNLTWNAGAQGMYCASLGAVSGATAIWSVSVGSISGDAYGSLTAGQLVIPFSEGTNVWLTTNNKNFNASATIQVSIIYM